MARGPSRQAATAAPGRSALQQVFRLRAIGKLRGSARALFFLVEERRHDGQRTDLWTLVPTKGLPPTLVARGVVDYSLQGRSILLYTPAGLRLLEHPSAHPTSIDVGPRHVSRAVLLPGGRVLFSAGMSAVGQGGQHLYLFAPGQEVRAVSAADEPVQDFFVDPRGGSAIYQSVKPAGDFMHDYALHWFDLSGSKALPVRGVHFVEDVLQWNSDGLLVAGSPDVRRDVVCLYHCRCDKTGLTCRRMAGSLADSLPQNTAGAVLDGRLYYPDDRLVTGLHMIRAGARGARARRVATLAGSVVLDGHGGFVGDASTQHLYFVYEDARTGPEIFGYHLRTHHLERLTRFNDDIPRPRCSTSIVSFPSFDGYTVDGVLVAPCRQIPGHRYPLIVNLHGGPLGPSRVGRLEQRYPQFYAEHGFYVLTPNYRGSYIGQSTRLLFGRGGVDDLEDIRRAIRQLQGELPLSGKVGVVGHSYGGYLAALMAYDVGIDAVVVKNAFFDYPQRVRDTPAVRAMNTEYFGYATATQINTLRDISPMYIDRPPHAAMLLIHGQDDMLPVGDVRSYQRRLTAQGARVWVKIYDGEGHSIRGKKSVQDVLMSTVDFLAKRLDNDAP